MMPLDEEISDPGEDPQGYESTPEMLRRASSSKSGHWRRTATRVEGEGVEPLK